MKQGLQSRHDDEEIRIDELARMATKEGASERNGGGIFGGGRHRSGGLHGLPKGIIAALAGLVILFIVGFAVSFLYVKHEAAKMELSQAAALRRGIADLRNFDPSAAAQDFSSLGMGSPLSEGMFGKLFSLLGGVGGAVHSFRDMTGQFSSLSQSLSNVQGDLFAFLEGDPHNNLVNDLRGVDSSLTAINADSASFTSLDDTYFPLETEAKQAQTFLDAFVPWLADASSTHHVLIFLENPSEMRPGGGFFGSYADVAIKGGAITGMTVHDIADVDAAFKENIVPPKPLQLEGARFRPADGNWFFDFPTSASDTIRLFEASGLYAGSATTSPVTFDGAIAVSPAAISDVLSALGPVTIDASSSAHIATTTFTADSLISQIQTIVQAGQAQSAAYPKAVLQALAQAIFAKFGAATDGEKQQLLAAASQWVPEKDVMAYFKNPEFENFIQTYGAAGEVYKLPQNFNGDYLAIANADINSDKSELYINQSVSFESEINLDGTVNDHLIITRAHQGNTSPYWWYKTTNTDYLQVFVPVGSSIDNESGGILKTVPAPVNYAKQGYLSDPLIASIESGTQSSFGYPELSSHEENGKEVFATWLRVRAGASTEFSFDYSHHLFSMPADGMQYQFVFERQSGAKGDYKFDINAPIGYKFAENGLPSYDYEATDTPGRLTIGLTLQKL